MRKSKLPRQKEESVHKQVAATLKLKYPGLIFRTDFAAGIKMTIGQAVKHKCLQSDDSYPDLFIARPSGGYAGLFLELKRDIEEIFKKDGTLKKKMVPIYKMVNGSKMKIGEYDHIGEQAKMLERLQNEGYKACFGCGYDHAMQIIDDYLAFGRCTGK